LAAFVDDFAETFAVVEAEDNFVAGFDAGVGFESSAIEFDRFTVDEILAFAACQFKVAVRFQRKWSGFAGEGLACYAGFGAGVLASESVFGGGLGEGCGAASEEDEAGDEDSQDDACGPSRAHTLERANFAPVLERGGALNLLGLR
jgi:hypothetical protein